MIRSALRAGALALPSGLICALLIFLNSYLLERDWFERLEAGDAWPISAPTAGSPSDQPLYFSTDSAMWLAHLRAGEKAGSWRVRHTQADNAPAGREAHWNTGLLLGIRGLGGTLERSLSLEHEHALATAAKVINPLLLVLMLLAAGTLVAWRRGWWNSVILCLTAASASPVIRDFGYGAPDHHGMHFCAAFLALLCITLARTPGSELQRGWFAASGIAMGMGMWIGATQQILIAGAIFAGAALDLTLATIGGSGAGPAIQKGQCWRLWGWCAAGTSLLLYLSEYQPGPISMRLEVNHPFHVLFLAAGGELLFAFSQACQGNKILTPSHLLPRLILCAVVAAILPVALMFGPSSWHALHDPLMLRMHHFLDEFRPMFAPPIAASMIDMWISFGLAPLILIPGAALTLFARRFDSWRRTEILWLLPAVLLLGALSVFQVRWASLWWAALLPLAVVTLDIPRRQITTIVIGLLIALPLTATAGFILFRELFTPQKAPSSFMATRIAVRDATETLLPLSNTSTVRIFCSPNDTPFFNYLSHGTITGVGSPYWENGAGLKDTAEFFSTTNDEVALAIAQKHKATHVFVFSDQLFVQWMCYMANGITLSRAPIDTLAYRLAFAPEKLPSWIKTEPIGLSPTAAGLNPRLYRIDPPTH